MYFVNEDYSPVVKTFTVPFYRSTTMSRTLAASQTIREGLATRRVGVRLAGIECQSSQAIHSNKTKQEFSLFYS